MQKQPLDSGFTLLEVMVVTAIIAILAAIAVPAYDSYITRGKITEATSNLGGLRVQMEQFYQDNRKYNGATAGACGVAMPSGGNIKYFTFSCSSSNAIGAGDQNYTITATGGITGRDQTLAGFSYTIDQTNNKTTTIASPASTAKWGTGNTTCWITRQRSC
jgi:type IV pilus assembly protein PilE